MIHPQNNRLIFQAPFHLVSEDMQGTINALLNADTYVCLTCEGDNIRIVCKSENLLLDCIKDIATNDKKFLDKLTDVVIDCQRKI